MTSLPFHARASCAAIAAAVALAGVAFAVRRTRTPAPVSSASLASPEQRPVDVPLPPTAQSDANIREQLSRVTPRALFQRWLEADALLDRLTVTIVNIAEGESPARQLPFLRPKWKFSAEASGPHWVISAESYARYDAFANVIASLDEQRVAEAYRALHPLLESAVHRLGYPGRPLDAVVARALRRLVDAPVRDEVWLERAGGSYVFADPALESLGGLEKQLLRMGPRNTRLIQEEARDIAASLDMPLTGPARSASKQ